MIYKRPARIWVICFLFILFPPVLFTLGMDRYALFSAPFYFLTAAGFLFVRKWSWYTTLLSSLALLVLNTREIIPLSNPAGILLLAGNIILIISSIMLFRKEMMAPYFFPRLRWWEADERVRTQLLGDLSFDDRTYSGEISDISLSGCFVEFSEPVDESSVHRKPVLTVHLRNKKLTLPVLIMRLIRDRYGAGCMFAAKSLQYKGDLEHLIRELLVEEPSALELKSLAEERFVRAKTGLKGFVIIQGISFPVKVLDISKRGTRISIGEHVAELLELNLFHLEFHGIVLEVDARIRHVQHEDSVFIAGLELFHSFQSFFLIRRLIYSLKHAGYQSMIRKIQPGKDEQRRISALFPFGK